MRSTRPMVWAVATSLTCHHTTPSPNWAPRIVSPMRLLCIHLRPSRACLCNVPSPPRLTSSWSLLVLRRPVHSLQDFFFNHTQQPATPPNHTKQPYHTCQQQYPQSKHTPNNANMPGGGALAATADVSRIEAPVTWKAYLICAFASFGGIFFGTCSLTAA